MTTEASRLPYVELLKALRNSNADDQASALKAALAKAGLAPEHQALVDLLLTSNDETEASAGRGVSARHGYRGMSEPIDASFCDDKDSHDAQEELATLREVNDTLAAALGACRYCWGGNRECGACEGYGRAGYFPPNMALFRELVLPAVKRVFALRKESKGPNPTNRRKPDRAPRPGNGQ
jgi:hypothetical protein